jgi:spore germination protein GerM
MARRRGRSQRPRSPWTPALLVLLVGAAAVAWWVAAHRPSDVEVYFVRVDAAHHKGLLEPVRRPAPRGPVDARLDSALRSLLAGPGRRDLLTEIPPGTTLLGVRVEGGTATVNFSKHYAVGGGSSSMLGRVWQVVYTATQFPGAPAVQILIEGRRVDVLGGEGLMIGGPLRRPPSPPSF